MLKAIDTRYAGYLFRSRLEARFAVFMDALGWEWQYEAEGYDLPETGFYLPDFKVTRTPGIDLPTPFWVEVKGTSPTISEINALRELACESGLFGFFFVGHDNNPPNAFIRPRYWETKPTFKDLISPYAPEVAHYDDGKEWMTAPFSYQQLPTQIFSPATGISRSLVQEMCPVVRNQWRDDYDHHLYRIFRDPGEFGYRKAAQVALSARFEHGAKGGRR